METARDRLHPCTNCDSKNRRDQNVSGGPTPPPEPAGARIISLAKITCDGIEVTQAIQNMNHDVPLVAGKRTIVRVYLSAVTTAPIVVQGVPRRVACPAGRGVRYSLGPVTIDPAENGQLRVKRESESKSLNFLLPATVCVDGQTEVRLLLLLQSGPSALLKVPTNARRTVRFRLTPPLRVRILGVRFQTGTPPADTVPSALDYTLISPGSNGPTRSRASSGHRLSSTRRRPGRSTPQSSIRSCAASARRM